MLEFFIQITKLVQTKPKNVLISKYVLSKLTTTLLNAQLKLTQFAKNHFAFATALLGH
jgi:hypothetical protein